LRVFIKRKFGIASFFLLALTVLCVLTITACSNPSGDNGSGGPVAGDVVTHTLNGVNVPFRYVPAGSFQRDATAANVSVITNGYWMGETEITQELFSAVMGANPSYFDGTSGGDPYAKDTPTGEVQNRRPVEKVSWYDVIAFCNKLSLAAGKEPVYSVNGVTDWAGLSYDDMPILDDDWNAATWDKSKNGYRLPTEMEWMWAAMGADKSAQPNTTGYAKAFAGSDGTNSIGDYAWYDANSGGGTHEVGKKLPNELGLRDMSGNVSEWCWDWDGSYPTGTQTNYDGAAPGTYRVIRDSNWYYVELACAMSYRSYTSPGSWIIYHGFRVVCP
jgi:formylglycine-generating enzyme required for sulfatase activity